MFTLSTDKKIKKKKNSLSRWLSLSVNEPSHSNNCLMCFQLRRDKCRSAAKEILSKINVIGSNKYQMRIYIKLEPFIFSLWLILKNCAEINLMKTYRW